jgi:hypothetical protein
MDRFREDVPPFEHHAADAAPRQPSRRTAQAIAARPVGGDRRWLATMLASRSTLRRAMLLRVVLDPPKALR